MLSIREKFISIVDNDLISPSDSIILLEGDGFYRYSHAAELYKRGVGKKIVFSGGIIDYKYGSFPYSDIYPKLIEVGVNPDDLIHESKSLNTKEQADEVINLALINGWKQLILVASSEHQYRAYLTFIKRIIDQNLGIVIINSPAQSLSWFEETDWGIRYNRLDQEFYRIQKYSELGHLATYSQAIDYQRWKEKLILK
jgi:uncharacterized SAM-binding protein YcdF (DUF218 family)